MVVYRFQCFIIFSLFSASFGRVIFQKDIVKTEEDILHPKSPTEKRHINIPMILPTDIIDLSQRIQRDQIISNRAAKNNLPAFEAIKPNNIEESKPSEVGVPNLGSILSGDKINPLPNPKSIELISNENCTEDCSGSCTDCECQVPEGSGAEGCLEGCDLQNCADKQENCDCENETGDSKEEVGELLREKRCCCGCCDCCCCCGCCGKNISIKSNKG
uniref:Uncharacterized protein n=1 Tax=Panagrolaimus davidi TaxID=227884 RepID=A0A914QST7_9BILA